MACFTKAKQVSPLTGTAASPWGQQPASCQGSEFGLIRGEGLTATKRLVKRGLVEIIQLGIFYLLLGKYVLISVFLSYNVKDELLSNVDEKSTKLGC